MKNKSLVWHIWGAVFIIIAGALLHFAYAWSGDNFIVGLFAPVNESIWEHMKLSFTPMLLFGLIEYFSYFKYQVNNYWFAHWLAQITVILFIFIFYTVYTCCLPENLIVDILLFVVGVCLGRYLSYVVIKQRIDFRYQKLISIILLVLLGLFFIYATVAPPKIDLFKNGPTGTYGIYQTK